ncbi:MAG: GNAT family N-acetyltransferase [Vicinamibacterales bacterium]
MRQIYDDTWRIWAEGLSRAGYERYNRAQLASPWGSTHLDRVALMDGDTVLASAKRYRLTLRVNGANAVAIGIGAVFTSPALRGRGHGAAIVEEIIAGAANDGAHYALLFSEIDPAFYARLGFEPIPIAEATLLLKMQKREGAPAVLMRDGADRDLDNISAMHEDRASQYAFSLRRDPDYVRFAISKRRLLAASGPPGLRHVEFFVTEEGGNAVAYVVVTRGPEGHVLEEWGDRDPSGARAGAMLQALAARTPAEDVAPLRTWLPADFHPPQLDRASEKPAAEQGMIRGIGRPAPALDAGGVFYLKADAF